MGSPSVLLGCYFFAQSRENHSFSTGNRKAPDVISVFVKNQFGKIEFFELENSTNIIGREVFFFGSFVGVFRIIVAVQDIFKKKASKNFKIKDCVNEFKNIGRGLVEFVPFSGILLYRYDKIRNAWNRRQLVKQLEDIKEGEMGLAIDGKILFQVSRLPTIYDGLVLSNMVETCKSQMRFATAGQTVDDLLKKENFNFNYTPPNFSSSSSGGQQSKPSSQNNFNSQGYRQSQSSRNNHQHYHSSSYQTGNPNDCVKNRSDYLKVLGLKEGASDAEIKKAYRKLSLKYHPDKDLGNPKAAANFQEISNAYQYLCPS